MLVFRLIFVLRYNSCVLYLMYIYLSFAALVFVIFGLANRIAPVVTFIVAVAN